MKGLSTYQQLQFAIISLMFLGWAVTGAICITTPEPTDFIVNLYGKLEAVFFTLASMKTLEAAIAKSNGGGTDEKSSAVDTPVL
jgi:hypothetical protein